MALRFIWFMALAFALVATVTFAGPAGEDDDAAMAAEKEYVTDPSTGKQVVVARQVRFPGCGQIRQWG